MTTPLGILSAAHVHTDSYARLLSKMDTVELVGVADTDDERGREFATHHGIESLPTDTLLDRVDGVVVCSPNAMHDRWIRAAAEAGVHVLCEKPLATNVETATDVVRICEEAGVHLGLAMPLRFCDAAQAAKARLDTGDLGAVRAVSGTNRGQMPGGWFADPDLAGGGAVMDHTVHIVDLVYHLTGQRVTEVYAEVDTRFHEIPVDDVNVLSMELEDGTQFLLDGSWSRPEHWHTWGDATVELLCADGVLSVDCFDQSLAHTADDGDEPGRRTQFVGTDPNRGLLEDFATAVAENRPPAIPGADGAMATAVVAAAYRSAERGEPVAVEY
ncbi:MULTISPECIES: Gfo/Idh/MocA family protein [unclassified Haladaptatus]|uniref:Gfo/Idh/MocA family protein n=1 Tax=unclassified Haladaptatus TaxID=2622732 RepID=UPI0023E78309|nr:MULTISPECIES: Gfo/Idh/MocA family oxidoreductase [unclassified Haladaptatus]